MSVTGDLVARVTALERKLDALAAKERPLVLRGWRDDFLGHVLRDQYTTETVGGGACTLQDDRHGGQVRFRAGATANDYHRLWLGDAADAYATLDADEGWVQISRSKLVDVVDVRAWMGATDFAENDAIRCGMSSAVGPNWLLETRTGGGAWNIVDSGVAADTDWHVHRLEANPTLAGRQVDYYLDGARIATTIVSVPTIWITPVLQCQTLANDFTVLWVDYWDVIPQNLA